MGPASSSLTLRCCHATGTSVRRCTARTVMQQGGRRRGGHLTSWNSAQQTPRSNLLLVLFTEINCLHTLLNCCLSIDLLQRDSSIKSRYHLVPLCNWGSIQQPPLNSPLNWPSHHIRPQAHCAPFGCKTLTGYTCSHFQNIHFISSLISLTTANAQTSFDRSSFHFYKADDRNLLQQFKTHFIYPTCKNPIYSVGQECCTCL